MAKIFDQHLGRVRGKVGDVVLKIRDGKSYVSRAPKKYKKTTKEYAIDNRDRFSMIVNFSKVVNKSEVLKPFWAKSKFKGKSAYSKIFSANHVNTGINHIDIFARIAPSEYILVLQKIILDESNLKVEFETGLRLPEIFPIPYSAVAIIHLSHPKDKSAELHKFITVEEEVIDLELNYKDLNYFNFTIGKKLLSIVNDYDMILVFFALISYPENKDPISSCTHGFVVKGQPILEKERMETDRIKAAKENKKKPKDADDSNVKIRIT